MRRELGRLWANQLHLTLLVGVVLVFAVCGSQEVLAYWTAFDNLAATTSVRHAEEMLTRTNTTRIELLEMVAAYRGFLVSGDEAFLTSYAASARRYSTDLATLEDLSSDDPAQLVRWQDLARRGITWQAEVVTPGIAVRRAQAVSGTDLLALAADRALVAPGEIEDIRATFLEALVAERAVLEQRHATNDQINAHLMTVLLWGGLSTFGVGLVVAVLFASKLKRALERLRAGETRYRHMFEGSRALQFVVDEQTGVLLDVNPAASEFYGYSHEAMLRMKVAQLNALPAAEQAAQWQAVDRKDVSADLERQHRLASGEVRDVEVLSSQGEMDGRPVIYSIVHEITNRKRAEALLRTSEERFRKQYKGVPLPTYSWLQVDDDFVMQDFNDAAEAAAEGDVREWIGSLASVRYAPQPEILADLLACVQQQRILRRELRFQYQISGRERDLALTYVFVPPRTVMLHFDDITERKQAEHQREALAQSEKLRALGQMASGIAHDLNQSLMLIASYSELARQALAQAPPDMAELDNLLATTTQAAFDGGETVKGLLLFTRAAPEHDRRLVNLNPLVRDAAQLTAPRWRDAAQAAGKPIALYLAVEGDPSVDGSPSQLRELMTNLIFNAVDALPAGGTIHLRVAAEKGKAIIEVADSGIGMTAEVQQRVFEPFFTTKGESGTGLGLAMVYGIVEQHGGHIEVRSTLGQGTTFRITLPLAVPMLREFRAPAVSPTPHNPPLSLRVLVVDDEPMMTRAVARMLKPLGHLVTEAASGEEALERLAEQTFDVIVSDVGMGAGMNGWELAEAVKHSNPDVRFLLATGWGAAINPVEARARGVDAVLAKPYRAAELAEILSSVAPRLLAA